MTKKKNYMDNLIYNKDYKDSHYKQDISIYN